MAVDRAPVLIVDDDASIRETVRDILDFEGYAVRTAENGAEALRILERTAAAVILLDMRMPVLDGWGFARAARERGLDVPILVMTAAADARRWCDEIGADGCVPKPFDVDEMLDAVSKFVSARG
jgi:CheY-like chemotaxis protein